MFYDFIMHEHNFIFKRKMFRIKTKNYTYRLSPNKKIVIGFKKHVSKFVVLNRHIQFYIYFKYSSILIRISIIRINLKPHFITCNCSIQLRHFAFRPMLTASLIHPIHSLSFILINNCKIELSI